MLRLSWNLPQFHSFLEPLDLIDDPGKATTKGSQLILDFDRRFLPAHCSSQDSKARHLAQPLVEDLGRESWIGSEEGAGSSRSTDAGLKEAYRPLAPNDALNHRRDRNAIGRIHEPGCFH